MKSSFYHIQFNIDLKNTAFYKDLLTFLGWSVIFEGDGALGMKSEGNGDIWFLKSPKPEQSNSDMVGVSHLAIKVESQKDVDDTAAFLKGKNIPLLFETPKHRAEFAANEKETYYQVQFESPDKILFEVVYVGTKA